MASQQTLAEAIVAALKARGVRRIFGVPGGGSSLDLIDAAGRQGVDFVLTRGETAAAIMAAVTAELSGAPGVVLTGIGPGAASAVNGVAYASLERAPLALITDAREPDATAPPHQIFDQQALFQPITKGSARLVPQNGMQALAALLDLALSPPMGPVHVDLSAQDAGATIEAGGHDPMPDAPARTPGLNGDLEAARALLAGSRRPLLIAGIQARDTGIAAALGRLAEALGCPVLTSYKAKGVLPDGHPQVIGHFTAARSEFEAFSDADLIITAGLEPVELIPAPWHSRAPLLVLSTHPGLEFPVTTAGALHGPLEASMAALAAGAGRGQWDPAQFRALKQGFRARISLEGRGHTAESITTATARLASEVLSARPRITVDAGAHMFSIMALWQAEIPDDVLKSNGLSTMGFALPAAIGAALTEPERPVIALTGDGGLMMCLAELSTAAALGCNLTVIVLNDAALSLIDIKQQRQQRPPSGVHMPATDFAAAARGLGCAAWSVGRDQPLEPALRAALAHDGPSLVDVTIDPSGYGAQLAALRG